MSDLSSSSEAASPARPVLLWRLSNLLRRLGWRLRDRLAGPSKRPCLPPLPKDRPCRVQFLVANTAKWSTQALFEALQNAPDFEPEFVLTLSDVTLRLPRAQRRSEMEKLHRFFSEIGPVRGSLYDPGRDAMRPAHDLQGDVVFLQQPWGMQDLPRQLSGQTRCAYVHYGYPVISNDAQQFGLPDFHPFLWMQIVPDAVTADRMQASATRQAAHVLVAGYPKLDPYFTPETPKPARRRVIYAPHHSLRPGSLGLASFDWSGPAMLDLAQQHPEIDFVCKPHPNLDWEMHRIGGARLQQYVQIKADWAALPNCSTFEGGGYFDLFRGSDLMVTDSGSFLAEYLPSGGALIRLEQAGGAALSPQGQTLSEGFYTVQTPVALTAKFTQLMVQGDDPLRSRRREIADDLLGPGPSGQRALAQLRDVIHAN